MKICARCRTQNHDDSAFCANCRHKFPVSVFKSLPLWAWCCIGVFVLIFCAALISNLIDAEKKKRIEAGNPPPQTSPSSGIKASTATPTPAPPAFAELKTKADELLKFTRNEYVIDDLEPFNQELVALRQVPEASKDYKASQDLQKKLAARMSQIRTEIQTLGECPDSATLHVAFNQFLRTRLNDYDSSEYVDYTPAVKVTVKGQPFWLSILRLRAKNAFGGYILKDVKMYLQNKQVVAADGL